MPESLSADELIATAQECYSLGLIDESRLELVTQRALSEPDYDAILDLPLPWKIEHERLLRRTAEARARGSWLDRLLRRAR